MEHYDWNDGWLFTPTFDPAIVRPECPELALEPVRIPHTVKTLPYNYCNENDYQRLCGWCSTMAAATRPSQSISPKPSVWGRKTSSPSAATAART